MENNLNSGVLFKNEHKTKDIHPDYKGSANINGENFEMGVWIKTSQTGKKYMFVKFSEPYKKSESVVSEPIDIPVKKIDDDGFINDDIPF